MRYATLAVLLLLVGCGKTSERNDAFNKNVNIHQLEKDIGQQAESSFVVTLQNGRSFRITPDVEKLKQYNTVLISDDVSHLAEQFEEKVLQRLEYQQKRDPNTDISKLVFGELRIRYASGACSPTVEFKVEDCVKVEELSK